MATYRLFCRLSRLSRRRCLRGPVLILAACWLGAVSGGCDSGRRAGPETIRIRVLTYNIHHGQGEDGKFDLPRLARVIADLKPDIVALQEVDRKTRRAGGVDQARELGRLTKMHAVFGKAMDYSGGQYGEAVLSRWPILTSEAHQLGHDRGTEPRAALAVTVRPVDSGPTLLFVGTHLDHMRGSLRLRQAKKLNELFAGDKGRAVILAGDLNAVPSSEPIEALAAHFSAVSGPKPKPTWPSKRPRQKIDYILFRPADRWRVIEVSVVDEKVASDHCPLLAVLEWRIRPPGPEQPKTPETDDSR